ncbi:hypothetical protein [uncultured Ornithinimicrobium sp.]|uniref:hypothetical protein n=1 Tax=uncultured Ornithinimicrobium sp. TaxID=259307 RepID=UPI0025960DC0|nr:hypothetical protein [uncultured Ornithinimicrobium sp.]
MGLQGRLEAEVWQKLARLSSTAAPMPKVHQRAVPKAQQSPPQRRRAKGTSRAATIATPRVAGPTAEQVEFARRLSELRGLLRAMGAGHPVNGVTPGVTVERLRQSCALASWLRTNAKAGSRNEQIQLDRMVLRLNLLVKRYPTLTTAPRSTPASRVLPVTREWQPTDVSKIPMGPQSSRWFMDPVNSK